MNKLRALDAEIDSIIFDKTSQRQILKLIDLFESDQYLLSKDANFWITYIIVTREADCKNSFLNLELARTKMEKCPNCNGQMIIDYFVDNAIYAIKKHEIFLAKRFIEKIDSLSISSNDQNCKAKKLAAQAIIGYYDKDFHKTLKDLKKAEREFLCCGKTAKNSQHVADLTFYILKCLVAINDQTKERYDLAFKIIGCMHTKFVRPYEPGDKRPFRRLRARFVNLGIFSNSLDDYLYKVQPPTPPPQ